MFDDGFDSVDEPLLGGQTNNTSFSKGLLESVGLGDVTGESVGNLVGVNLKNFINDQLTIRPQIKDAVPAPGAKQGQAVNIQDVLSQNSKWIMAGVFLLVIAYAMKGK